MPDPTPEQPPSWPPASEPAAKPTNPPRITARGVGHLPSSQQEPEEDVLGTGAGEPAPDGFAGLTAEPPPAADSPLPSRTPEVPPPPVEPEPPRRQKWGEAPDMSGQWPPPENQDWISQQSRTGGWGASQGGASWPGSAGEPEPSWSGPAEPEHSPSDQSYTPNPSAAPYGPDPDQASGGRPEGFTSEPYQAAGGRAEGFDSEPHRSGARSGSYEADPYRRSDDPFGADLASEPSSAYSDTRREAPSVPSQAEPVHSEPPRPEPSTPSSEGKVTAPPTHAGVRYTLYGLGGIITLGLIIAIVVMLGGPPAGDPSSEDGDEGGGSADGGGGSGQALDAERYAELAAAAGTAEWFEYRYGTPGENTASEETPAVSGDALTDEPLFGDADRSVQGQLAYVTDEDGLSGVDHVSVLEATDDELGVTPRAGGQFSEEGVPELELEEGSTADCLADLGGEPGAPVALARPEQSGEVDAHSVIVFSGGVLATAGISGAQGGTCLQLPDGLVPTDVALTDGNELALVTTWNPAEQTGALVVVALADKAGSYNSSWSEPYPGLPNPGHFGSAEIVGQVDLPLTAPTSVDAWSDSSGSMSTGRTTVEEEPHADTVATTAYALIGSLSESQAVTVDLSAVLTGLADQHIEGAEFAFEAAASEPASFDGGVADVALDGETFAVATGDGVLHELDAELSETAAVELGPNPSCLVVGEQSGQFIATTRGDSAVRWVSDGEVVSELTDAHLTDALCASESPSLDAQGYEGEATVLLVADYEGRALHTYLVGPATLPSGAEIGGDGFAYGGSYTVQGRPFDASVTLNLA
jgi:hypothetical protein